MPKKGYTQTQEHRDKTAAALHGNQNAKGHHGKGFTGTHSEATRAKMRASRLAYMEQVRAERRRRGGLATRGKKKSPAHTAKLLSHQVMRVKMGARWRSTAGKKGGAVTGSRPRTQAQLDALAMARAARTTPHATKEAMLLIARTNKLRALLSDDLLIVEDLAVAPDAKAHVRSLIDPRITYTLADARFAGYAASAIAKALGLKKRRGYEVLRLLHRADADRVRSPKPL